MIPKKYSPFYNWEGETTGGVLGLPSRTGFKVGVGKKMLQVQEYLDLGDSCLWFWDRTLVQPQLS